MTLDIRAIFILQFLLGILLALEFLLDTHFQRASTACAKGVADTLQQRFHLDSVAFFGRTMEEYLQAFALSTSDLIGKRVLDCPSGPDSFVAEVNALGCNAVGVDLVYDQSAAELEAKGRADIASCLAQMKGMPQFYPAMDFDQYSKDKTQALELFIADYKKNRKRYFHGSLPKLPFADRSFDIVLSAHLLFVYSPLEEDGYLKSGNLDLQWHHQAVREIARVSAREIRLYPTAAMNSSPRRHRYIQPIMADLCANGWRVAFEPSQYRQLSTEMNDCLVARRLS